MKQSKKLQKRGLNKGNTKKLKKRFSGGVYPEERCKKGECIPAYNYNPKKKGYTIDDIFNFFEVDKSDKEYFKYATYDAFGLNALLNWINDEDMAYTYDTPENDKNVNKSNINLVETKIPLQNNNNNKIKDIKKGQIFNPQHDFSITKEDVKYICNDKVYMFNGEIINISNPIPNPNYKYLATFSKDIQVKDSVDKTGKPVTTRMMCRIFKKEVTNDIVVVFKWGFRFDMSIPYYDMLFKKINDFIIKILEDQESINNILLFGFSMGGNLAQRIALLLTDNENYKNKVFFVSLAIGATLKEEMMHKLNSRLKGKFISIGFSFDNYFTITHKKVPPGYVKIINSIDLPKMMNQYILNDEPKLNSNRKPIPQPKTIKTLMLNIIYNSDNPYAKKGAVQKFTKYGYSWEYNILDKFYDYDEIKDHIYFEKEDENHNFIIYHRYFYMLMNEINVLDALDNYFGI